MSNPTLGEYLREWRLRKGITQESLARAAGVTKAYISMIESDSQRGELRRVSPDKLAAFADALGIPEVELLNRANCVPPGFRVVRNKQGDEYISDSDIIPEWEAIQAAGYTELPRDVREEIQDYIAMRAKRLRSRRPK
jgi:transcriptional regulator with XRE-family HTH domain